MALNLSQIKVTFDNEIQSVNTLKETQALKVKFLGKKGLVTFEAKKITACPPEQRKDFGIKLNQLRSLIEKKITALTEFFKEQEQDQKLLKETIDVTLPGRGITKGMVHPLTHSMNLLKRILLRQGFIHIDGPEIDSEWYNFSALNIGEHHPARQMADTFYIKDSESLLRTHTSNVQVRHMQNNKPPFKIFSLGRVYRSDYDATHTPMFHQLEALVVNEKVNFLNLKSCIISILQTFFATQDLPIRFRNSYFPFTEPSFEIDVRCDRSNKGEIKIGCGDEWLEIMGCGMVNNKVFKNTAIDPSSNQGFALGIGIERLAMLKYNIADVRDFYHGDIRWLQNYGF